MAGKRSKKPHPHVRRLRQGLETAVMRGFLGAAGLVPRRWHEALATRLGGLLADVMPLRRRVIDENLLIAFPEKSAAERRRLRRDTYIHTLLFTLELAYIRKADPAQIAAAVVEGGPGREHLEAMIASGQGFLIGCAHFGNWEWLGAWMALRTGRFGVVYKPMHNPGSEALAQELRGRFGMAIFSTRERVPRGLFGHLRKGGIVAILADQDARKGGTFYPFFGRPASTATGLASLAVRLGTPILPGFCLRDGLGRFSPVIFPPLYPDPQADPAAEEERLTRAYLACIEEVIRLAPAQYFWLHQRWKTRPKGEGAAQPGALCNLDQ